MTEAVSAASVVASHRSGPAPLVRVMDRWIFVFTNAFILAVVLAGFIPNSIGLIGAVRAHVIPRLPVALHVHAVLMGSWIVLLLTQSVLVATGRTCLHRRLGVVSVALVPAIVIVGMVLVPTMYRLLLEAIRTAPPAGAEQLKGQVPLAGDILLGQIRAGVVFPLLVGLGLLARRSDPATHKRLMILAILVPLAAATDRMDWLLPSSFPGSPITADIYPLVVILPLFVWDLLRLRAIQRAYWICLAVNAPFIVAMYLLWNDPRWLALVPRIMGVP